MGFRVSGACASQVLSWVESQGLGLTSESKP